MCGYKISAPMLDDIGDDDLLRGPLFKPLYHIDPAKPDADRTTITGRITFIDPETRTVGWVSDTLRSDMAWGGQLHFTEDGWPRDVKLGAAVHMTGFHQW